MNEITLPKDWMTYGSRFLFSTQLPQHVLRFLAFSSALPKFRDKIGSLEFEQFFGRYTSGDAPIALSSDLGLSCVTDRFSALSSRAKEAVVNLVEDIDNPSKIPGLTAYFVKIHIGPGFFEFLENLDKETNA